MMMRAALISSAFVVMQLACAAPHTTTNTPSPRVETISPSILSPLQRQQTYAQFMAVGLERAQQGDYGTALGDFEKALELNPNSCEALIAVGACHESIGDPIEAIRCYRRALAINPLEPDAFANLGTAYIKLFHRENNPTWRRMALGAWRQSLALHPDQPDIRDYLQRESAGEVR